MNVQIPTLAPLQRGDVVDCFEPTKGIRCRVYGTAEGTGTSYPIVVKTDDYAAEAEYILNAIKTGVLYYA